MIATGSGDEILHDATRASNGDLVMTGYVRDTANFDLGDREVSVSAVGEADGFVVRRKP
jgi:hypothetical protein